MPFSIDDSTNPSDTHANLNLIQSLNTMAFVLKKITGQASWKVSPPLSLGQLGTGDKGEKGDTGAQGIQGLKGDKGDIGATGAQGIQGLKGDKGATGAQGIQGLKGDKGDIGATGTAGAQGVQGLPGSTTPEAWQDLVLATNWTNNGGNSSTAQCRKIVGSLIEVKGTIKKSTALVAGEIVATLPAGYAPTKDSYFITWNNNGHCRLQLGSDGTIKVTATSVNTLIALSFMFGLN